MKSENRIKEVGIEIKWHIVLFLTINNYYSRNNQLFTVAATSVGALMYYFIVSTKQPY